MKWLSAVALVMFWGCTEINTLDAAGGSGNDVYLLPY